MAPTNWVVEDLLTVMPGKFTLEVLLPLSPPCALTSNVHDTVSENVEDCGALNVTENVHVTVWLAATVVPTSDWQPLRSAPAVSLIELIVCERTLPPLIAT